MLCSADGHADSCYDACNTHKTLRVPLLTTSGTMGWLSLPPVNSLSHMLQCVLLAAFDTVGAVKVAVSSHH